MILKKIEVQNFRNISHAVLDFSEGVNILFGDNAQGKTNLLEAISLTLGKSFRKIRRNEILPHSHSQELTCKIKLYYESENANGKLNEICYESDSKNTSIWVNKIPLKKAEDLYGEFKYVVFIPDSLNLIKGEPAVRRLYLDNIAIMQNKVHRNFIREYNKALRQRNALLFNNADSTVSLKMLEVWNDILIKQGINLTYGRLKFLEQIKNHACNIYSELSGGETLQIKYKSNIYTNSKDLNLINSKEINKEDLKKLYKIYRKAIQEYPPAERTCSARSGGISTEAIQELAEEAVPPRSSTSHLAIQELATDTSALASLFPDKGVHRDDIMFTIDGKNARIYASQGQLRSIAIALKLAEAKIIKNVNREKPVVLLDEVLGELDKNRRKYVLKHFEDSQVFITTCNRADYEISEGLTSWKVSDGKFS
ncbi:MAG: DNA replication and repair protein RecF [Oscillospiraceae bacterium]|nr:DNA replication and repair protein RecF [Oscillospiraceae bacterium]